MSYSCAAPFAATQSPSRHRYRRRRRRRRLCRLIACWNSFWGCCNISATANGINLNFNLLPRRQLKSCPGTWNPADPVEAQLQLPACYFISFHLFILSYLQNNCINKYFKERYAWPPSPCVPVSGSPAPLRCPLRSLICCILITIARQVVHSSTRQSDWQMWLPVAAVAARLADCSDYLCVFLCACVQSTSCTCPTLITFVDIVCWDIERQFINETMDLRIFQLYCRHAGTRCLKRAANGALLYGCVFS